MVWFASTSQTILGAQNNMHALMICLCTEVNVGSARSGFSSDELIPITSVELNLKQTCKDLCKGIALNHGKVANLKMALALLKEIESVERKLAISLESERTSKNRVKKFTKDKCPGC